MQQYKDLTEQQILRCRKSPRKTKERDIMLAFVIWTLMGIIFVGMGIYDMCSKKEQPFGFSGECEDASYARCARL